MSTQVPYAEVEAYINQRAADFGVDPATARAFLFAENVGKDNVTLPEFLSTGTRSPRGALGPMQVMPNTYAGLVNQNYLQRGSSLEGGDWQHQTDAGLAAIAEMQKRAGNDPKLLAAHYNGGNLGLALAKAGKFDALTPETQRYLRNVETALGTTAAPAADASPSTPAASQGDVRKFETGVADPSRPAAGVGGATLRAGADAINGIVANYSPMVRDLITSITGSREEQAAAMRAQATEITNAGVAAAEKATADGMVREASVLLRERLLKQFDLGTKDTDGLIARTLTEQRALQDARRPLAAEIDARMNVGFFDDPLQWLVNQTVLPGIVNEHNANVRRENELTRQLTFAQNAVANQERIDVAADVDLLGKQTAAAVKAETAGANAKVAEVNAKVAALGAQTAMQIGTILQADATFQSVNLQRAMLLQARAEQGAAKAREAEELKAVNDRLRVIGDAIGAPGVNLQSLRGRGQKAIDEWQKRANTGKLGDNLAEALTFISDYGNLDRMAASGKAEQVKLIRETIAAVNNKVDLDLGTWATQHPGTKVPTREELRNMVLRNTENSWKQAVAVDMGLADKFNPYRIDHSTLVKDFKGSENNQVYLMVKGAIAQGVTLDDRRVLAAATDAVTSGQMDPRAVAAQLSEYYRMGVGRNNANRSFDLLGMEKQSTYLMKPKGAEIAVDLMDQTAVENMLVRSAAGNFNPMLLGLLGPAGSVAGAAYDVGKKYVDRKMKDTPLKMGGTSTGKVPASSGGYQIPDSGATP